MFGDRGRVYFIFSGRHTGINRTWHGQGIPIRMGLAMDGLEKGNRLICRLLRTAQKRTINIKRMDWMAMDVSKRQVDGKEDQLNRAKRKNYCGLQINIYADKQQ